MEDVAVKYLGTGMYFIAELKKEKKKKRRRKRKRLVAGRLK